MIKPWRNKKVRRIIIVEDQTDSRTLTAAFFRRKGAFEVDEAKDGYEAILLIENNVYDLAILDIMIPGPSGFDVCKILRRKSRCPIVFLTALGNEDNILKGYALGADEYMVKPFSIKVLFAKCLALLARLENGNDAVSEPMIHIGEIHLDPIRMEVSVSGKEVELSPKEYFLLKVLMENPGHVFGREKLLNLVWGMDFDGTDRVVDNHIKKLRQKLGTSGDVIKTVFGSGYKITP